MLVSLRSSAVTMTSSFGDNDATAPFPLGPTGPGDRTWDGKGDGVGAGKGSGLGAPRYARAEWIHMPDFQEMLGYWPAGSWDRGIGGSVELACIVPKPGKPKRCWIISEHPRGIGFGRAALAMSRIFRIKPVLRNDDVLDLPVIVPVVFNIAPIPKAAAPKH
jgi:protein TonB